MASGAGLTDCKTRACPTQGVAGPIRALASLDTFTTMAHLPLCPSPLAFTKATDCSKPPMSMNGGSKPVGCGGAVWMNDKPSRKYCDDDYKTPGAFKFQWWRAC